MVRVSAVGKRQTNNTFFTTFILQFIEVFGHPLTVRTFKVFPLQGLNGLRSSA